MGRKKGKEVKKSMYALCKKSSQSEKPSTKKRKSTSGNEKPRQGKAVVQIARKKS